MSARKTMVKIKSVVLVVFFNLHTVPFPSEKKRDCRRREEEANKGI